MLYIFFRLLNLHLAQARLLIPMSLSKRRGNNEREYERSVRVNFDTFSVNLDFTP